VADRRTSGTRTTKAERKEQARQERLELQRKMARSHRNRRIALATVVVVAAGALVFALTRPETAVASPDDLLAQADEATQAAGCRAVENVGPYQPESQDQAHISTEEMPPLSQYASVPPASGPHNPVTLAAGVYDSAPPIDRLIHSLEHGAGVIWYSPTASGEQLERLREFYGESAEGDRVIVAPYDYPSEGDAGRLPAGTQMALVAWHTMQTCSAVNLAAAFDFTARYSAPPFGDLQYRGEAPEAGNSF
jgi:hypothetical protein